MSEIIFNHVDKCYPNKNALHDISFSAEAGEFIFLIGKNGAGKSTLLKLLSAQEPATSGEITACGIKISAAAPKEIIQYRRKIGIMTKEMGCVPYMTVYNNIELAVLAADNSVKRSRSRIFKLLSQVGIENKSASYPNELSEGERARVLLARALVNEPSLLILDEPTENLDEDTAWDLMLLLKELNHQGLTIIMASHARQLITIMKQRVISLSDGIIISDEKKAGYNLNALTTFQYK